MPKGELILEKCFKKWFKVGLGSEQFDCAILTALDGTEAEDIPEDQCT